MSEIKKKSRSFRKLMLAASAGLAAAGLANRAMAAINYFDLTGATAGFGNFTGTLSWDAADWSTSSAGTAATTNFTAGVLAEFNGTSAGSYIVTVATTESDAGIFLTPGVSGITANINQSGTGSLSIVAGFQGFSISSGDTLVINAPMTGTGGVQEQGSGQIALYGNNTFSGGYETTGGQITNYNNANSFGTGKIFITGSGGGAFVSAATSQVTIANAWSFTNATTTTLTNFNGTGTLASPGVIFSGGVALPTVAADTVSLQTGPANTVTEFSGAITGTALVGLTITANASTNGYGTIILAGADTYSGTTTITNGTNGGTAVTLAAGAVNALSVKSAFTDNSILNLQGFNQSIGSLQGSGTVQLGSVTAALLTVGSNNGTTSFTGLISGTGSGGGLTKIGTGTFTLTKTGGDTYLGPTTISTGVLAAGAANSFAPNSDFTVNATLNLAGFAQVIGSLSGTGTVSLGAATDGILSVGSNGSSTTFSGNISGTGTGGGLTKIGTGTLTLATTGGEVYNGPTAVNGGVLAASASNVLSTASALTVAAAGTVSLGGFDQTMGSLAGAGIVNLGDTTAANLTVGGNNTSTTFSGSITGTGTGGSLIKAGTGIFSMTSTNGSIFLGDTTINAGTLSIVQDNDLGANGTGNVNIGAASLLGAGNFSSTRLIHLNNAASTIDASSGKTFEIDSVIDGTGGLTKGTNAGTVLLTSNANIYAGITTINGGTLAIDDDGSLGASGGTVTINAGTLLAASNVASARPIIVNRTNSTVDATGGNTFTITGNISGTGSLTKGTNLGTVLLNNTGGDLYTGATTVNGGVLSVGGSNTLPSATAVTVNAAGTLSLTGFDQTIGSLTGAGTVNLGDITAANLTTGGNNTSTTFSGSITGTGTGGGLFKVGTGTFALTSTNGSTYLGDTTISGGTLSIVQDNDLGGNPAGNINIGAATLLANGNILTTRTINLNDPASTLDAATGDTLLLNGLVAGSGGFTKGTNASTVVLSQSSNTYGGDTTINGGTLIIAGDGSLGTNTAGNVNIGAATLLASGNIPTARTINLNNAASTVDAVGGDTLSLNGLVAGSGALTKGTNASTVLLSGTANTYLGNTTVNGGTLGIAADGSLGAAGGTVNLGAATLLATSSLGTARNLNLTSASSAIDAGIGNTFTLSGVIGGSGSLNTGTSGGIIVLSGTANTYLGNTAVNGDTLAVGADGSLGAGSTVNIGAGTLQSTGSFTTARNVNLMSAGSTIDVTAGNILAISGTVSGSGSLNTGTSGGTLNLTGVGNTYAGNTTINSGVLEIAGDGSLGSGGTVNVGAGALLAAGNITTARSINLTDPNAAVDASSGSTLNLTGVVNGTGGLTKGTNAGAVLLSGTANAYLGNTTVSGGTLGIAADGSLGAGGTVNIGAGTLLATNSIVTSRSINVTDPNATVDAATGNTFSLGGVVGGSGGLTKGTNASVVLLSGTANTYLGNTTINGGTLGIADNGSLGAAGGAVNIGAGTLLSTTNVTSARTLNLTDPGSTVDALSGFTMTLNGTVGGTGGLTKGSNGGGVVLSGTSNAYAGNTTINGGTLEVAADGSLGVGTAVNLNSGNLLANGSFTSARTINIGATPGTAIDATTSNALVLTGAINDAGGGFTKGPNASTVQLAGTNSLSLASVNVAGGLLSIGATTSYTNTGNGPVAIGGGLAAPMTVSGALTISGGAQVALNPTVPGLGQTHSVGSLSIGAGGSMDIGNHTVLVQNAPDETVIGGYLSNGYAGGFWNGTSATGGVIKSVVAFNDNSGATSIGYGNSADFTFGGSTSPYRVGGTKALSGNQVIVAPALAGDLLLEGSVGPNDLALMLGTFGTTGNDWAFGNIDYDAAGSVGPNDLSLLLSNFGQSSAGFASAKAAAKSLTSTAKPSLVASASDVTPPPADGIELIVNFQSGDVEIEGNNATAGTSIVLTSAANGLVGGTTFTPAFSALFNTSASNTNGLIDQFNTFTNGSAVNGIVDMGDIYNTIQNSGDVQFQFSEKGINRGGLQTGSVTYVGVPEPTTMTLLAVASAGLLGRRRRKAQRQD